MLIISMVCMAGDSDNFTVFLIWHVACILVMIFCIRQIGKVEEE
jgi:hypothetical protein